MITYYVHSYLHVMSGIVKYFDEIKGYGFIEPKDGGEGIYVHITSTSAF